MSWELPGNAQITELHPAPAQPLLASTNTAGASQPLQGLWDTAETPQTELLTEQPPSPLLWRGALLSPPSQPKSLILLRQGHLLVFKNRDTDKRYVKPWVWHSKVNSPAWKRDLPAVLLGAGKQRKLHWPHSSVCTLICHEKNSSASEFPELPKDQKAELD